MFNEPTASTGGDVAEKPKAKVPSRATRITAWKKENTVAHAEAHRACCMCAPSKAQMLLVDQFAGNANIPID